ncbi:TIGR01212 family radical SAM protein, partial [bacterium]|nr:TIGR01212 family radical SAM protein [bacterium]
MDILPDWGGQSYYPISRFYRKNFGERVHKISVSTAQSCPNREKNHGVGCIFCDEWGSAGSYAMPEMSLREQIQINREKLRKRFNVNKFIVYFQSFTNTFMRLSKLKADIETALSEDSVEGVVLGTRPDCLPPEIFPLLRDFNEHSFVSVELGVQSFLNERLDFLKRGHTAEQSLEAIKRLHEQAGVNVGIHLIFGLPGETQKEIMQAAEITSSHPVNNVKLHNLHVLANTPL